MHLLSTSPIRFFNARLALAASACAALVACGAAPSQETSYPSSGSQPYSASATSFSPPPSAPAVPARETVSAGIVVRPDLVCVPFAVRVTDDDANAGVAAAHAATDQIVARLRAAAGNAGALKMRGVAVAPAGKSKAGDKEGYAVVVDGAFEVPMPTSFDFWARSKLVSALVAASKQEMDAHAGAAAKVSFEMPQMRVADPEAHRAALTKQWIERARAFSEAAQGTSSGPLALVDCAAPGEIAQRNVSTEEVALSLSIACRLDARPAK